ncbi:hypothetical protein O6H91_06G050600 [Diphasiastrum complanatum]|uniref:Uncharacterized protein n=1 Tax=Diphasiastrum complanatum TaxID=34168 RepID=A0ACC2DDL2_DIPCM|nr:hypothetical protein O6H91_06G050600 [Diphasiastrum complanatum]
MHGSSCGHMSKLYLHGSWCGHMRKQLLGKWLLLTWGKFVSQFLALQFICILPHQFMCILPQSNSARQFLVHIQGTRLKKASCGQALTYYTRKVKCTHILYQKIETEPLSTHIAKLQMRFLFPS